MTTNSAPQSAVGLDSSSRRVNGLDSIRFLCAFVVVVFHIGLTAQVSGANREGISKYAIGIYNGLFNGPAAVIVFFIISGFCIHFPFRERKELKLLPFYSRRLIRIAFPVFFLFLLIVPLSKWSSFPKNPLDAVIWSLVCEVIYYLLYPLLLVLRRQTNTWMHLIRLALLVLAVIIATHLSSLSEGLYSYTALGYKLTWIVGLPCWLLGCWLAENYHSFSVPPVHMMWTMRAAVYFLSIGIALVRYHIHTFWASNCILLDLFAAPACCWLAFEIAFASKHARVQSLEWAGTWSYSLYLLHPCVMALLVALGVRTQATTVHLFAIAGALVGSYLFFRVAERPSHRLAVFVGRSLESPPVQSQV